LDLNWNLNLVSQFDIQREALLCIYNVVAASPNYLQTLIEV
jgi:hypothetical protein